MRSDSDNDLIAVFQRTDLLTIPGVVDRLGGKVSLSTALRWCADGVAGVKLRSYMLGGKRMVAPEDLTRFLASLTRGRAKPKSKRRVCA